MYDSGLPLPVLVDFELWRDLFILTKNLPSSLPRVILRLAKTSYILHGNNIPAPVKIKQSALYSDIGIHS